MADIPVAINIENLSFRYNSGNCILNGINLSVAENEFIAIAGKNGCGKTTLLKVISGLLRPERGNIFIRGTNAGTMGIARIAGIAGFVMQDPDRQLFSPTVYDEVIFALKRTSLSEKEIEEKAEQALAAVGLSDKRNDFPPAMSRADKVKTVFAAVLAMGPKIIMLDEPSAGQDYAGSRLLMGIAAGLHQKGYTIILVTHNMGIVAEYAQRLIVMKDAQVSMDGNPREIFGRANELAEAGVLPPQVTRLSQSLRKKIPLVNDALMPAELASALACLKA